jgi:hypothetical protein
VLCRLAQIGPRSIGRSCHRSSWRSSSGRGSTSPRRLRAGNAYLALDHRFAFERPPPRLLSVSSQWPKHCTRSKAL